ncbi:CoA-acylating methylmalonate-semialdehyde dehydrogenase [Myxococcota bacterium]|nr:CoA-acylating methylmalonate-semialdehyde dehydrogenase [Myxococcota bacterium]
MNAAPRFSANNYDFVEATTGYNWIGGQWVPAASGETIEVINPRYNKALGAAPSSDARDVEAAVAAAEAALPAWQATPIKQRVQVLYKLKALMERDLEALTWLVSHENGKVYGDAQASVLKGIECVDFGSALDNMSLRNTMTVSRGVSCRFEHEPLGIVAGISPFNFPIMVPLWMLPQALMAGNAFILKPSEQVPYSTFALAQLLQEAGLPDGIFNVVCGARPAVEAIVDHPKISAVGFVGSTKVAQLLYARGAALGKRMLCLGGAKNHLVVVPDADVELTATNIAASAFGSAGQRCMAASVMLAVGDVQHIIDAIADKARAMAPKVHVGAITNQAAKARITGYIDQAEAMGAQILVDGRGAEPGDPGNWVGATLLDQMNLNIPASCEEIFGPVLSIIRVNTLEEALSIENANPYGNAAAVYTTSGAVADYCVQRFEAGMIGVNIGVPVPREPFSFGGWRQSKFGHGDITGVDGFRFWTRQRKVTTKWALQADQNWMS